MSAYSRDASVEAHTIYAQLNEFQQLLSEYSDRPAPLPEDASVDRDHTTPLPPDIGDLCRLHRLVRERKVTTILEFGVGFSSVILADALRRNREEFGKDPNFEALRRNNPFELHSVDAGVEFIKMWRERAKGIFFKGLTHFHESSCRMGSFEGRACHYFDKLPDICPDFIYLDAPSLWDVQGDIRGISTRHSDRLPMSADLLVIEYFLLPGTLILIDGRTSNARFLRDHFKRNWRYKHDTDGDVHLFELVEPPVGRRNRDQLRFCLGESWLKGNEDSV